MINYIQRLPQVLNLTTGSITTQFHVVCDGLFTTVHMIKREEDLPSHWNRFYHENTTLRSTNNPPPLSPEWLVESDDQHTSHEATKNNQVRQDRFKGINPTQTELLFLTLAGSHTEMVPTTTTERMPRTT